MRKDIYMHFLTNLNQSKWGILLNLMVLVFFAGLSFPAYYTGMNPMEYVLEETIGYNVGLLVISIFTTIIMISQNYRFGKTRWLLMRKDRRVYILGDIFFIFCILLLGWMICMLIIYYKYSYQIGELRKYEVAYQNIPTFLSQIKSNEWYLIIYPTHVLEWIIKPIGILCMSTILGYLVNFIAMAKKDKNNLISVIGLSILFYVIKYVQSAILAFMVLILIAIISYKLSVKIWANIYIGGSYAEN